jgi:putative DNA methylase
MTAEHPVKSRKMLIETALPLEAINAASAREKSIRHGHPSTLHLWWARRPLAAARAVIFAQMVIDPSDLVEQFPSQAEQDVERERLFELLSELVKWESTTNEKVLERARAEIRRSWRVICADNRSHPRASELFDPDKLPGFHDPFAGGGALPLEAQRLGLKSYASDLNPVAVLINKAMIEIPPKFAGCAPVNPAARKEKALIARQWKGAQGLAEDVRYYGQWMRDEAEKRIGHLYPPVEVTDEMAKERPDLKQYVGEKLTLIACLWARTVKSPNPAFASVDVPLVSTFLLSSKPGKEAFIEPVVEDGGYRFTVKAGKPRDAVKSKGGTKSARANFICTMSGASISGDYVKAEGKAGRMNSRLMALVAEGRRGRVYLGPTEQQEAAARGAKPAWKPSVAISGSTQYLGVKPYGMTEFGDVFTNRQLVALTTFSELVSETMNLVRSDAIRAGLSVVDTPIRSGGAGAAAYAEAVGMYLAFAIDKGANYWSSVCAWHVTREGIVSTFGRQAIPMVFDYAEANPLSASTGNFLLGVQQAAKMLDALGNGVQGSAQQADAATQSVSCAKVVSTDPPYFDNVPYADLSDFFYVWLRYTTGRTFPDLFATVGVPKSEELVAFSYRHDSKAGAEDFFLRGMTLAMRRLVDQAHSALPVTIYYAFRQAEHETDSGSASTGWETFLDAVNSAGFSTVGTWPVRTEYTGNLKTKRNALASSIVIVCRKRQADAPSTTRQAFVRQLDVALPDSIRALQLGGVAPVDMAQAAIGPGMAVFTKYSKVLEADGSVMSVRAALVLINEALSRLGDPDSTETDDDTRWAVAWFEQHGFEAGDFGQAQVLAGAKNVGVNGLVEAGIVHSRAGKVRLMKREELHGGDPASYDPGTDDNVSVWEALQHLVHRHSEGGAAAAGALLRALPAMEDQIKDLAYRLYGVCERKKWAQEAMVYNALVAEWSDILAAAAGGGTGAVQVAEAGLFGGSDEDSSDE